MRVVRVMLLCATLIGSQAPAEAKDQFGISTQAASMSPTKVGMFYLLWHCFSLDYHNPPYSIATGIATGQWGPYSGWHWWGQPQLGYYCLKNLTANTQHVLRTHAEQLRDAGIDFVYVDFTNQNWTPPSNNDTSLESSFQNLLSVWSTVPNAPKVVPWVPACMTCSQTSGGPAVPGNMLEWVVSTMAPYSSLSFYHEGRPLILLVNHPGFPLDPGKRAWAESFATVREMWAFYGPGDTTNLWSFLEACADTLAFKAAQAQIPCNQRVTWRNGQVEQVSIASAYQMWIMSRTEGSSLTPFSSVPKFGGWTFRRQFDRLRAYPAAPIATITGWNEWQAQRGLCDPSWAAYECIVGPPNPDTFNNGNKVFVDLWDHEYNRDIECDSVDCRYLNLLREVVLNYKGGWIQGPGAALDIGAGGGQVWITGTDSEIYFFNGSGWTAVGGAATRIDVGPDGQPWVINSAGAIYRRINGTTWSSVPTPPGTVGLDIGIGANGSVWLTGANQGIYQWNGSGWSQVGGAATRVDVAPDGSPWVVNSSGAIFRWIGGTWQGVGGLTASDIGIGANGVVYATRFDGYPDSVVHRFTGGGWDYEAGAGSRVSVTWEGVPMIVASNGNIYYRP